jgi:hypothetical protein
MKKIFSTALVVSMVALVPAGAALADPGLPNARAHQHFVVTPNGDPIQVGPDFCSDPDLQEAFNQFHFNIHHSGTLTTSIETLGPQDGAPGLHNGVGADIVATRC